MSHDFISAGLLARQKKELDFIQPNYLTVLFAVNLRQYMFLTTGFNTAFDSVLCSKSETIMFLATTQRQINSVNTSCALVYLPSL